MGAAVQMDGGGSGPFDFKSEGVLTNSPTSAVWLHAAIFGPATPKIWGTAAHFGPAAPKTKLIKPPPR